MLSTVRILVVGSGLLGLRLHLGFLNAGFETMITYRSATTEKNPVVAQEKARLNKQLAYNRECNTLDDYKTVVQGFKPTHIIDTIPQPPIELVNYLLSVEDCFKVEFSSPASDFAKACPEKCPSGSYPGDKLTIEKLVNERGKKFGDALVIQIGFIPEIATFSGKPVSSGLSFETMIMCNLLTGAYNDQLPPELKGYLEKFDKTKGFTCTTTKNIYGFLNDIVTGKTKIPVETFGRTLAFHSSQVWPREQIVKTLVDVNHVNELPRFYGQKSEDKISKPVREFEAAFEHRVTNADVIQAIRESATLFQDPKNRELLIEEATYYAKK